MTDNHMLLQFKKFFENPDIQQLLKQNKWENLYKIWDNEIDINADITDEVVSGLTTFLFECGIDPLKYMKNIPNDCLCECDWLSDYIIPASINTIGDYAFSTCVNLQKVTMANSVTSIGEWAFCKCAKLQTINLSKNIFFIDTRAFFDCRSLQEIVLPEKLERLMQATFEGCTALTTVTMDKNIRNVGFGVFEGCKNLRKIIYKGSKKDWNNIFFAMGWDITVDNCTVVCTDESFIIRA